MAGLRAQPADPGEPGPDPDGRGRMKAGQLLLIWGFAWSFVAIGVIIPHFNPAHLYQYWSDGGVLAPGGHPSVIGLIRQLVHAWPDKLQTLVMLLLPAAFIALRSPLVLIAAPSLLLRFISTNSSFWGTYWHYNATVMPIIFVAAIDALARIGAAMDADAAAGPGAWASGRRGPWRAALAGARRYGAAMMVAIAVPLAFQFPLSQLWNAADLPDQPARRGGRRGHGPGARRRHASRPRWTCWPRWPPGPTPTGSATAAIRATQYIVFDGLDSDYSPAIKQRPRLHRAACYPRRHLHRRSLLRRRLRLPPHPLTQRIGQPAGAVTGRRTGW